ncbi:hypothetical protein BZA70DRAFT_266768 [Myxozyma melibiosi]|uniref:Uncharacterized protein n=1 Tax=Myxozyma melibiosi TaxID=54550 RepID=A0ABR1F9D2_9ASCO
MSSSCSSSFSSSIFTDILNEQNRSAHGPGTAPTPFAVDLLGTKVVPEFCEICAPQIFTYPPLLKVFLQIQPLSQCSLTRLKALPAFVLVPLLSLPCPARTSPCPRLYPYASSSLMRHCFSHFLVPRSHASSKSYEQPRHDPLLRFLNLTQGRHCLASLSLTALFVLVLPPPRHDPPLRFLNLDAEPVCSRHHSIVPRSLVSLSPSSIPPSRVQPHRIEHSPSSHLSLSSSRVATHWSHLSLYSPLHYASSSSTRRHCFSHSLVPRSHASPLCLSITPARPTLALPKSTPCSLSPLFLDLASPPHATALCPSLTFFVVVVQQRRHNPHLRFLNFLDADPVSSHAIVPLSLACSSRSRSHKPSPTVGSLLHLPNTRLHPYASRPYASRLCLRFYPRLVRSPLRFLELDALPASFDSPPSFPLALPFLYVYAAVVSRGPSRITEPIHELPAESSERVQLPSPALSRFLAPRSYASLRFPISRFLNLVLCSHAGPHLYWRVLFVLLRRYFYFWISSPALVLTQY